MGRSMLEGKTWDIQYLESPEDPSKYIPTFHNFKEKNILGFPWPLLSYDQNKDAASNQEFTGDFAFFILFV